MKKITYEQACKMISSGKTVVCRISSRDRVIIKNKSDLDAKKLLHEQGAQDFQLFSYNKRVKIPDNAKNITIDEAFELIDDLELIYCIKEGEEEEITTRSELSQYIMSSRVRGEEPVLYRYVQ